MAGKKYDDVWPLQAGVNIAITRKGLKHGLVDANEQEIIEPTYDVIFDFIPGCEFAIVGNSNQYGAINPKGEVVLELVYTSVTELILKLKDCKLKT